ncbi:benzoate/H(+) symporter BenE family transporter [Salmonella enterica subsp. houtenae]|nr:benzoate/H(+) symporter BenE family transporter [Salmonella enterica subsp. houtenae]
MRLLSQPLPTILSGLIAVLVGYASSAAIIWQAALAAGATPAEIAGWMTALGIAMGISTLTLTLWYRAPVLTAWSTPGAALLVTGLQGLSLPDAVGIFIVANTLIMLCGVTGLFARLMRIIPHSLAAAMLAGILLRFGLQAFGTLNGEFVMCGGMLLAWLLFKVFASRYAVIAAMVTGITVALMQGKMAISGIHFAPVWPTFISPHFSFAQSLSVAVPLFLVTMASQNAPGVATMKASGYLMVALPVSWVQMLAGLALLSTISGSLYQALTHESERDAAIIAFLVTASGLTLIGIGSAFWGGLAGGIGYAVLTRARRPSLSG